MTAVGFEPTQLALVELESTPSNHSGKLSYAYCDRRSQIIFLSVATATDRPTVTILWPTLPKQLGYSFCP